MPFSRSSRLFSCLSRWHAPLGPGRTAVRLSPSPWQALGYLADDNLMFILPLLTVLALALAGLRVTRLLQWSRRSVVLAKVLAALLFLVPAILLLAAG